MSYSSKNTLIFELQKDFYYFKQNEPNIIEPIKYPISISNVRPRIINWLIFLCLITITSLSLGTKLEEINCNYTSFFTEKILNTPQFQIYRKTDLTKMEFEILKKLNFKILYSTAIDFSNIYLKIFTLYCKNNQFLIDNFKKVNEDLLKKLLLNDMIITISQSQIADFSFTECLNTFGINIFVLRNIENILVNSIINIPNQKDNNNKYNIKALYSL